MAIFITILVLLLIPLVLPLLILVGGVNFIRSIQFCSLVRLNWYPEKKYVVFVYSDSPNWKEYIEANLLPKVARWAVVLNWSDKVKWNLARKSLAVRIFEHWAGVSVDRWRGKLRWGGKRELGGLASSGGYEYNPIAIVFVPWWKPSVIKFWQAFKDYKHGREQRLKQAESQLFTLLDKVPQA